MVLGTKIAALAVGSVVITAVAGLAIQRSVIRRQGIEMTKATMRSTILSAENARRSVSAMRGAAVFDDTKLAAQAAGVTDYKQTNIYKTVPVVAAWDSITEVAEKEGYQFRVPAPNPRNSKNAPTPDEQRILSQMDANRLTEYFAVENAANEVVYARPIVLSSDCLLCHGDGANSPTKDGKDLVGFRMEGWHDGDRHGMFVLRSNMDHIDAVVNAGMKQTILWLLPLSLCVGLAVYFMSSKISSNLRTVIQSISNGSSQVTSAVDQISASSHDLAQGASQQAASLEETSAASEEIACMIRKNADNSRSAAVEMDAVNRGVQQSNEALTEMNASMQGMKASSDEIGKIIKVIDGIAFQTNILALNAAVEAARAGESGAGFAVVADEVRNLAQRSAQAARDTAPLIEDAIAKSRTGSEKLDQVAAIIHAITASTAKVKILVDEVNLGSQEQARGIEQVTKSIQQMDQVTQRNAASSEESASATEELAGQARSMDGIARQLRVMVEG